MITVKNGGKLLVNAILYTHVHVHVFHTNVYIWNEVIVVYMCGVCRHPAQAERLSRGGDSYVRIPEGRVCHQSHK